MFLLVLKLLFLFSKVDKIFIGCIIIFSDEEFCSYFFSYFLTKDKGIFNFLFFNLINFGPNILILLFEENNTELLLDILFDKKVFLILIELYLFLLSLFSFSFMF